MESVWWLLGQLYDKNLMYKGYTIQPYSPKAGTGLSSHEINLPGSYRDVTDTTVVAQFKMVSGQSTPFDNVLSGAEVHFMAWTTTSMDTSVKHGIDCWTEDRVRIGENVQPIYI